MYGRKEVHGETEVGLSFCVGGEEGRKVGEEKLYNFSLFLFSFFNQWRE